MDAGMREFPQRSSRKILTSSPAMVYNEGDMIDARVRHEA